MKYVNQSWGTGEATINVIADTSEAKIFIKSVDSSEDDTVIELRYEEVQALIEKLSLAAELAGRPPLSVTELHRMWVVPSPPDEAA